MRTLDFTPPSYRVALARRARRRRQAFWLVILVGALGGWTGTQHLRLERLEHKLASLQQVRARQEPMVLQSVALERDLEQVAARQTLYANLCGGARMHRVLAQLSTLLPDSVVLSQITIRYEDRLAAGSKANCRPDGPGHNLAEDCLNTTLTGYAARVADVGRLVHGLTDSDLFTQVQMNYARAGEFMENPVRVFEIQCRLPQFE